FTFAANLWGSKLDSKVEIKILATFEPRTCTATSAVLGSAGARFVEINFPNAEFADTWYGDALANKRAGFDLTPPFDAGGGVIDGGEDIRARFNVNLGNPGCLTGTTWYYGLDTGHAANQINLVTVLLHEFGHGLNFQTFVNGSTGAEFLGAHDIYERYLGD